MFSFGGLYFVVLIAMPMFSLSQGSHTRSVTPYIMRKCNSLTEVLDTSVCQHGAEKNNMCGKMACLKGLGEVCDNDNEIFQHGKCAPGLLCCDRCVGCRLGKCDPMICQNKSENPILNAIQQTQRLASMLNIPTYDYDFNKLNDIIGHFN